MSKGFYGAFSEQMDRLQSSVADIREPSDIDDDDGAVTVSLPIGSLAPGSNQPRRNFRDTELEELAESIRQQGLIQPVVVRASNDDNYEILAGERRWRACKLVGMETINAIVKDVDDQAALAISLIENIQRENLNPIEEAEGYQKLINDFGLKQSIVSQLVGKSRSRISRLLSLLNLPDSSRELISDGELSGAHGIVLAASALEEAEVERLAELAIKDRWSRDQLEKVIQKSKSSDEPQASTRKRSESSVPAWVDEFRAEVDAVNQECGWHVKVGFDHRSNKATLTIPFTVDAVEDFKDATDQMVSSLRRVKRNPATE
jgi:ParB family chromosome partitioning protein